MGILSGRIQSGKCVFDDVVSFSTCQNCSYYNIGKSFVNEKSFQRSTPVSSLVDHVNSLFLQAEREGKRCRRYPCRQAEREVRRHQRYPCRQAERRGKQCRRCPCRQAERGVRRRRRYPCRQIEKEYRGGHRRCWLTVAGCWIDFERRTDFWRIAVTDSSDL